MPKRRKNKGSSSKMDAELVVLELEGMDAIAECSRALELPDGATARDPKRLLSEAQAAAWQKCLDTCRSALEKAVATTKAGKQEEPISRLARLIIHSVLAPFAAALFCV